MNAVMLDFQIKRDADSKEKYLETSLYGKKLLSIPQLNKGTAFTLQERIDFGLLGKLPERIETLEEQVERVYEQCKKYTNNLNKNIYLNNLHDKNQLIFYKLISEHLEELVPIIYTPTVGDAVISFSRKYRQARGMYMSYTEREHIDSILDNRSNPEIDIVVITDGEAVLGIGDQGIGGMDIPIAKLMVYSLCGGINPNRVMPMVLDVGTDNEDLLNDPDYLGWKHKRLRGKEYDNFVDNVVRTIRQKLPKAFIHWEDFGTENARNILQRYQSQFCTFNDDIQGTGATTLAALYSATTALNQTLSEQKIVIFGAGAAGCGIADQIVEGLVAEGLSKSDACSRLYLIDRQGLLTNACEKLHPDQQTYAKGMNECGAWGAKNKGNISLLETICNVKPTVLIGCSAVSGAFSESVVREMAKHVPHPIIMPLSNPTSRSEAQPEDLFYWTEGKALVATGSPFADFEYQGRVVTVAQCNNARIFPGVGLGVIACQATKLSKGMLLAACKALSDCSPVLKDINAPLLPGIKESESVAKNVAYAVAQQAHDEGLSKVDMAKVQQSIHDNYWVPEYLPYVRVP